MTASDIVLWRGKTQKLASLSQRTTTLIAIRQRVQKEKYFQKAICQKYTDILHDIHFTGRTLCQWLGCNSKVGQTHVSFIFDKVTTI